MHSNNVNVNGFFKTPITMNNVNDNVRFKASDNVERIAGQLCDKFGDYEHKSFPFYCKLAYKLSESQIWNNFEQATTNKKVTNPAGLFNWLCRKDMNRG